MVLFGILEQHIWQKGYTTMIKNILIAYIILISLPTSAMKRLNTYRDKNHPSKKKCLIFSSSLPLELDQSIISMVIDNELKLRPCIRTIKSFALTNKQSSSLFNNQKYIDDLIERLSKRFYCSHEAATKALSTPKAINRLSLQKRLFYLCLKPNLVEDISSRFDLLLKQGANVDFTYNYAYQPQTLLMIKCNELQSIKLEKEYSPCFCSLVEKANFNQQTQHNKTLLIQAVEYPIRYDFAKIVIKHEKIDINWQNSKKETALLHCIKNRKKHHMTKIFVKTIKNLLQYGANPLLADNLGKTPLEAAYEIPDVSEMKDIVIKHILKSIVKQQATSTVTSQ